MKIRNLISAAFLVVIFGSCVKDTVQPVIENPAAAQNTTDTTGNNNNNNNNNGTPATVSFATDLQPFFTSNCASCHTSSTPPELTAGVSYNALQSYINKTTPESSALYLSMKSGGSMASYSNATITGKVLTWIREGARNN